MAYIKFLEKDIIELKNKGYTNVDISKILKCSLSTVKYNCRKNNLVKKFIISEEQFNNLKNDIENGLSQKDASEKYKISISTIKRYIKKEYSNFIENRDVLKKQRKYYRKELKIKAVEYKGGCCQICGYKKSLQSLAFHHIDDKLKDFQISSICVKWETMKNELDKCILICNNCHGEVHEEINEKGYSDIINNLK